jgi:hypothetical protein
MENPDRSDSLDEPLPQIAAAAAAAVAAADAAGRTSSGDGISSSRRERGEDVWESLGAEMEGAGSGQLSSQGIQQHKLNLQQQQQQQQGRGLNGAETAPQRQQSVLHVVACVSNTASKAVAAAFFGSMGPDAAAAAAAAAAKGSRRRGGGGDSSSVVGACEFSYELIVPGEVESAVLVQVAGEPLYTRVSV